MFGSYAVIKPAEYVSFSNHPNQFVIEPDGKASYFLTIFSTASQTSAVGAMMMKDLDITLFTTKFWRLATLLRGLD